MVRHNRTVHGSSRTAHHEPVTRITDAPVPLSDDLSQRTRRYLIQMSIRVVCFVGAVLLDHWTRWLLLVGAVVLPYFAVVLANAARGPRTDEPAQLGPREIGARPEPGPGSGHERDDGHVEHPDEHPDEHREPEGA